MDLIEFSFPFSFLFSLTFFSISRLTLQARFLDLSVLYQEKEKIEMANTKQDWKTTPKLLREIQRKLKSSEHYMCY